MSRESADLLAAPEDTAETKAAREMESRRATAALSGHDAMTRHNNRLRAMIETEPKDVRRFGETMPA
jgi:hypothetical protein